MEGNENLHSNIIVICLLAKPPRDLADVTMSSRSLPSAAERAGGAAVCLRLFMSLVRLLAVVVFSSLIVCVLPTPARGAGFGLSMLMPAAKPATVPPPPPHSSVLEAFGNTRLFQLAEGKSTANLHEMLQPAFWLDTIKQLVVATFSLVPRVLAAAMFLVVFWVIYRTVRRMMLGAMTKAHVDPSIRDLLVTLSKWAIMGFGIVIACNQIGIPIVAMLTGVSILGLAVGFAAQETLANFIAGIVIFWDKPFKVGESLTVENTYGQIQRITFRSCRLLTGDGEIVIYPNTFMLSHRVANHSAHLVSRIKVAIPIPIKVSIPDARRVLMQTTKGDRRILHTPEPEVVVTDCTDSLNTLVLRFWIADAAFEHELAFCYREKARVALDGLMSDAIESPKLAA